MSLIETEKEIVRNALTLKTMQGRKWNASERSAELRIQSLRRFENVFKDLAVLTLCAMDERSTDTAGAERNIVLLREKIDEILAKYWEDRK